jgi:hypothetical protein
MFFSNKIKYKKWYSVEDDFNILFEESGFMHIKYGLSNLRMDFKTLISAELMISALLSKISGMPEDSSYVELEKLSIKELKVILDKLLEEEDYESCKKIQKIIDEKEKDNKES